MLSKLMMVNIYMTVYNATLGSYRFIKQWSLVGVYTSIKTIMQSNIHILPISIVAIIFHRWITNGTYADFFTVAVRTGGEGMAGTNWHILTILTSTLLMGKSFLIYCETLGVSCCLYCKESETLS